MPRRHIRCTRSFWVREAGGQQTDGGLLVAHAQDHFMMATLAQELAEEIVDVYRALGGDKRRQSMKILLVCSAGMSTDILRGELIKYAKRSSFHWK